MNYRVILGCCLLMALSQSTLAAKVYTWTDEHGVTHYGEHPPKGVTAKKINARTGHSEPIPEEESSTKEPTTNNATEQPPQSNKDPESCEIAQKNLEAFNSKARLKIPDGNGGFRYITDEERQTKLAETQKLIEEHCE